MTAVCGLHAVKEALQAGRPAERLLVARGRTGSQVGKLVAAARKTGVPVRFVDRRELDRTAGATPHQGVVLLATARRYAALEDLVERLREKESALLVLLDGIEDPHNLGAILRTAVCAGADGVLLPERRAAGLTPAAEKAAAGAAEHIPVARVTNLNRAIEELKQARFWLVGLDAAGDRPYDAVDLTGRIGLVLGGEGKGLHRKVREHCDFVVSIPLAGPVASLNASVAAGIALYEAVRQRRQGPTK